MAEQTRKPNHELKVGREYIMDNTDQKWFYTGAERFSRETAHVFICEHTDGTICERTVSKLDIIVEGDKVRRRGITSYFTIYYHPRFLNPKYDKLKEMLGKLVSGSIGQ